MRTFRQHKGIRPYAVLAIAVACIVGLTPLQACEQDLYQDQSRSDPSYPQQSTPSQGQGRDMQLEHQIASALRQQGYGAQGEIMILATGDHVILLGAVPSQDQKDGAEQNAEQTARPISGVQDVQNNLRVGSSQGGSYQPQGYIPSQGSQTPQGMGDQDQTGQSSGSAQSQYGQNSSQRGERQAAGMSGSDMALARQVVQQLQQQLSGLQNIQVARPDTIYVMAAQGTVRLEGFALDQNIGQQAEQIASAIPGAQNVANALRISGAGAYPSYGYIPGQEQQSQQGAGDQGRRINMVCATRI